MIQTLRRQFEAHGTLTTIHNPIFDQFKDFFRNKSSSKLIIIIKDIVQTHHVISKLKALTWLKIFEYEL